MKARRARVSLVYEGVDITADIAEEVISITYVDALDEADRLSVSLRDEAKKWLLRWKPGRGDRLSARIETADWTYEGDSGALDCGSFVLDQVRYAGRPTTVELGGVSLPVDDGFVGVKYSRTWNRATLSEIARSLLPAGYALDFRSSDDPPIEYMEQKDEENIAFLFGAAKKYGFVAKIFRSSFLLASAAELDAQPPSFVVRETDLASWELTAELTRTKYNGCTVKYKHPETEDELTHTFMVPGATGDKVYETTQAVSSVADAERVAKAELRRQNEGESALSFSLIGNTDIYAGTTCALEGFGDFDGRYFVARVEHALSSSGYETRVDIRRCLEGY